MTKSFVRSGRYVLGLFAFLATVVMAPTMALAQAGDWQVYFVEPASPIMNDIIGFNNGVMVVITLITLFVLGLLAWVIIRYRAKVNPVPSKTTHNTVVEVLWTVVPVIILVGIAIPSFSLLFAQYDPGRVVENYDPEEALTLKVTGLSWAWEYEYLDLGIRFRSDPVTAAPGEVGETMFGGTPLRPIGGEPRLLETTAPFVVPVNTVVRLQVTAPANSVIHAFSLNAMGVKLDAVPGRLAESWFLAEREGTYYGQCSELCGRWHYAMPIELRVVSAEQFEEWTAAMTAGDTTGARALLDAWEEERLAEQVAAR